MSTRRSARISAATEVQPLAEELMPPPAAKPTRKRKAPSKEDGPQAEVEQQAPATPPSKRGSKARANAAPPATPTPSNAKLMGEPAFTNGADTGTTRRPKPAAVTRLADPRSSNATLLSPETSRIVASTPLDQVSPSKAAGVRTTTANILDEACAHLISVDARMKPLIDAKRCEVFSPERLAEKVDPFEALSSGIISQQVSGAAAKAIKKRFVALFDDANANADAEGAFPHPSHVASKSIEELRSAGLSQRKAEYIQGLAEKFVSGELSATLLHNAPYEEVLEKLIAVRGLGKWSVEMFACFALKRMDVFSLGDLGIQKGMAAFVGRDVSKLKNKGGKWKYMNEKEMEEIAEKFAPYRSVFMWYMWRVLETDISTME
jgi:DNA-3-methyladenine glycosylase II